jgi:hypothetical protein
MKEVIEIWDNKDGTVQAAFICPGCGEYHAPTIKGKNSVWGFNGNLVKPTFTPSILVRWTSMPKNPEKDEKGEYILDGQGKIKGAKDEVCHSFVTDGKIRFLGDCTHELKNTTASIKPYEK